MSCVFIESKSCACLKPFGVSITGPFDNPPITPSVPLRDGMLQGRVCDKEPLSRGHFGHQKRDDVISDRSVVSLFLCGWFPQKMKLLKSPCPGAPRQTHTVCKKQYGTAFCPFLLFALLYIKASLITATVYHGLGFDPICCSWSHLQQEVTSGPEWNVANESEAMQAARHSATKRI